MWLTEIFKALGIMFGFGTKLIPPEEVRIGNHNMRKPRLQANEKQKMLKSSIAYLRLHLRQSVDTHIEVKYDGFDTDDKEDMRQALYEIFPARRHTK